MWYRDRILSAVIPLLELLSLWSHCRIWPAAVDLVFTSPASLWRCVLRHISLCLLKTRLHKRSWAGLLWEQDKHSNLCAGARERPAPLCCSWFCAHGVWTPPYKQWGHTQLGFLSSWPRAPAHVLYLDTHRASWAQGCSAHWDGWKWIWLRRGDGKVMGLGCCLPRITCIWMTSYCLYCTQS